MDSTYHDALRVVADAYTAAVNLHGGKSLSRVATIVVNRGSFFTRLGEERSFSVANLERFATWFRDAANWPLGVVPSAARVALSSIGRPVLDVPAGRTVGTGASIVACDRGAEMQRASRA